jgi:hypothetical protein
MNSIIEWINYSQNITMIESEKCCEKMTEHQSQVKMNDREKLLVEVQTAATLCFDAIDQIVSALIPVEQNFRYHKQMLVTLFKLVQEQHEQMFASEDEKVKEQLVIEEKILGDIHDDYQNRRRTLQMHHYDWNATFW